MLQIKQLNKSFSNKQIFKNFNYTLETQDHLLISGVSGSGKSTLAQIIAGLDSNYQGTLIYNDLELDHTSQHKWMKHIQYVPQYHSSTLDPNKTVHWILKQPLIHFHYPKAIHEDRIKEVMSQCKLESQLRNKKVSTLSGGQFQRLWIAKALLVEPDVLILDEATTNLDVVNEDIILQMLREFQHLQLIIITHDSYVLQALPGKHLNIG